MSVMSRLRTWVLLMWYDESPSRCRTRFTEISAYCDHWPAARPRVLSKISSTLARARGLRLTEPLKMTSIIESPRSADARVSPSTQRTASMTLDLPQPLGPTMPTSCPGTWIEVGSTNDLNPESLIWVRRTEACFVLEFEGRGASESRSKRSGICQGN